VKARGASSADSSTWFMVASHRSGRKARYTDPYNREESQGRPSESVRWAPDSSAASVEDVGVDHGRLEVAVAEELLDRADVVAGFQQVGGEGVPQGVRACGLGVGLRRRAAYRGGAEGRSCRRERPSPLPVSARPAGVAGSWRGRPPRPSRFPSSGRVHTRRSGHIEPDSASRPSPDPGRREWEGKARTSSAPMCAGWRSP
jgi:hypothetical protein